MNGIVTLIIVSILPFVYLFTQQQVVGNFSYTFANIAGLIGAVLLFWEFILGIKELAKKLPINTTEFIRLHIFLGVWGMFFVLVHPLLEMMVYAEKITYLFVPQFTSQFDFHVTLGRFALLLVILVWLTSSFLRNKLSYKWWLNVHYLSYPLMFFVFIHALNIGSFLNAFVGIKIYWFTLLITYILLCIWRVVVAIRNRSLNIPPQQ